MINGFRFMKLFELFLDKLSNTTLFEMAMERKIAKQKATDLSPQIIDHIIKIFIIDDASLVPHWIIEIDGWLRTIQKIKLKPSNKRIDFETLYKWMVFDSAPHYDGEYIEDTFNIIQHDYKKASFQKFDSDVLMSKVLAILKSVCEDIAVNKFISIENYL